MRDKFPVWPFSINRSSRQAYGLRAWFPVLPWDSSSHLTDMSGNNIHAVNQVGSPTATVGGRGYAADVDSGDASAAGWKAAVTSATVTEFTLFARGLLTSTSDNRTFLSYSVDASGNNRGTLVADFSPDDVGIWDDDNSWLRSGVGADTSNWVDVCGVWRGDIERVVYINGVRKGTDSTPLAVGGGKTTLFIGIEDTTQVEPYHGYLKDARFYTRALSDAEVLDLTENPWELYEQPSVFGFVAAVAGGPTAGSLGLMGVGI